MKFKILFTMLIGLQTMVSFAAQISAHNDIQTLIVDSKYLKEKLSLTITLPEGYESNTNKTYPIIFNLHPRSQAYISGAHDWLSHNAERPWLDTIIVTPTNDIVVKGFDKTGFAELVEATISSDEDKRLLTLLESDILAAVDKNYRTNKYRIYSGFMRNGAIGLHLMLHKPQMFNAYLIASPTLANDFMKVTSLSEKMLPTLTDKIRTLYISAGDHRFEQQHTSATKQFISQLEQFAPKELQWQGQLADNSHYMSRPINNLVAGIEMAFSDVYSHLNPSSDVSKQGMEAIIAHYEQLSKSKYGFKVSAEQSLISLAEKELVSSPDNAISILNKTVTLYSQSPFAFNALANAYAQVKDYNNAIKYQTLAIENSSSLFQRQKDYLQSKLAEYKKHKQG